MESQYKAQLKSIVLNLRHTLEGRYDDSGVWHPGDLEEHLAAIGVRRDRESLPMEELSHLSAEDLRARQAVDAFIQSHIQSGRSREEAIHAFVQESAYTWANRLIALRCMEARGLIDEVILQKESYGGRSLKHHRLARQNPELCAAEDDGLYAVLFAEFADRKPDLPLLFRPDEPVIALRPGVAALKKNIQLLSAPDEIFTAPDALGWAYQYWNTEEKERVFTKIRTVKGAKIEKGDIIPVTQLYTEPYMVKFLVQNSLGAIWMAMHSGSRLCESWAYFVRDADRTPVEKKPLKQVSFLDPCGGSGHFLLEAFDLLYAMYMEEGELTTPAEICEAILNHNLYGIDIDERAIQIAALALYMKAREKAPDFRPKRINLVATNIHPAAAAGHLTAFLAKHPEDKPFQNAIRMIFDSLRHADELGSLLQIEELVEKEIRFLKALSDEDKAGPPKQIALFLEKAKPEQKPLPLDAQSYEEWKTGLLARLNAHFQEEFVSTDFSSRFFGETAAKGLSLFDFLSRRYDVVATNPPYMGSKNMGSIVKRYVGAHFTPGKRDLYAAFILRCLELAKPETGRVAMVTQQSWMFLRSFAALRALDEEKLKKAKGFKGILREASIETLVHLGPGAFGEISGEVVNIVLFTLAKNAPADDHRLTAFRLIGPKSPEEKDMLLKEQCANNLSLTYAATQGSFSKLPESPIIYWFRNVFFEIIARKTLLKYSANTLEGLNTTNNLRFLREFHEIPRHKSNWVPYSKGGGYCKWHGLNSLLVRWDSNGERIKARVTDNGDHWSRRVAGVSGYFQHAWGYSLLARGSIGLRELDESGIFDVGTVAVFPDRSEQYYTIAGIINSYITQFIIRGMVQSLQVHAGYLDNIPVVFPEDSQGITKSVQYCLLMKRCIASCSITDKNFSCYKDLNVPSLTRDAFKEVSLLLFCMSSYLHANEFYINSKCMEPYIHHGVKELEIYNETGTPAGWFPLIHNYDALPPLPSGLQDIPNDSLEFVQAHDYRDLPLYELGLLKQHLHALYQAGPGTKDKIVNTDDNVPEEEDEESDQIAVGTCIPIPAETFLEELSQKLEVHPISVYWLLKEGIEKEGWRCLPEEQRLTKDRFTVLILRLLGHRWPKQIEAGEAVPDWADYDGVIPLWEGTEETTLYQRLRERLAADYGDERVSSEENAFEDLMGKPLHEWLRKDFFRHHISQFRKRPIAWHLSSARWTSGPRQEAAFECLVYYHKTDGDLLPKIRSQYVSPLIKRMELELHGLENGGGLTGEQENRKALLQDRLPELKALDRVLSEVIADGFGPENMKSILRQYAINDAMLCLKVRWLKKLSGIIRAGPLADWQKQVDQTGLHADFSLWISDAITHMDYHCAVVGPKPPEEKTLDTDPTAKELAEIICSEADGMLPDSLKCACTVWWKSFDSNVLKPLSEKIRDAKKQLKSLKERSPDRNRDFDEQSDIKRKMNDLKSDVKVWQNELTLKTGQGKAVRDAIESWPCPEAMTWEPWLAEQEMYDQLSGLNAKRPPPRTLREFVQQESLYQPDINDGVRVNIAPLQKAGLLTTDVLAGKDVEKAIADRAAWRDDERRWCREGKLPKPGWWE